MMIKRRVFLCCKAASDCTVCCLLLDACPVLPSQLDNAINTATPNTQVFTEHNQVFTPILALSLFLYLFYQIDYNNLKKKEYIVNVAAQCSYYYVLLLLFDLARREHDLQNIYTQCSI